MRFVRFVCLFAMLGTPLAIVFTVVLHAQTYSVLYNFPSQSGDPYSPTQPGIVAQGRDGNLYSTTLNGGAIGYGTVFKITSAGTLTVLYSFGQTQGGAPNSGLTLGTDGNFYGTALFFGAYGKGTVFKVTPDGSVTSLHDFFGGDGAYPEAPPVQGTDGNFYGTTPEGGNCTYNQNGCGTIYKLTPSGTLTLLYVFDFAHGANPGGPLLEGTDGSFYGVAGEGGADNDGVIFKITSKGKLTVLHNFDGTHGSGPVPPLTQGSDGNFYGTTFSGGLYSAGVIYKMAATGRVTVLHEINGTTDGRYPASGLVRATDGNFYGTTSQGGANNNCAGSSCGTLFRISPQGTYLVLYNFEESTGFGPSTTPMQHTSGVLYAMTTKGGTAYCSDPSYCGVFYSFNASLPAFVSLLPYSGKIGRSIEFLGQGFTGTTGVSFNGTAATFMVVSDNYLKATVPSLATTGFVTVATPSGTLTSNKKFRVIP
jgi:uncharacterized repeat protein (TIGR03803 family)